MRSTLVCTSVAIAVLLQASAISARSSYDSQLSIPDITFKKLALPSNGAAFGDKIEGASVDNESNLYAVDFTTELDNDKRPINTIGRVNSTSAMTSLFYTDADTTTYFNGIRFVPLADRNATGGRALLADVNNYRVIELSWTTPSPPASLNVASPSSNGKRRIFCQNSKMLQPNDLAVSPDGNYVYLSGMKGTDTSGEGDLWLCDEQGTATLLDTMGRTNGIEVSPDGTALYVSEAVGGWTPTASRIWKYTLDPGTGKPVGKQQPFFDFNAYDQSGNIDCDGMRTDIDGTLYVTRNGGGEIVKIPKDGQNAQTIKIPFEKPANLELGGIDGKALYVVAPFSTSDSMIGGVAAGQMSVPGRAWTELQKQSYVAS
jgi:sugar lactone lactonase YvrE